MTVLTPPMMHWVPHVPVPVNLRRLFPQASFVGCGDIRVTHVTDKSSDCRWQSLFAAIRGTRTDGRAHLQDALARGASAVLVDHPLPEIAVPQCVVTDVRRAYAELCSALMANPSRHLGLTGVTGTNGKTTVTWLIRSILQAANRQTGLLGTIEYNDGATSERAGLTTPDPATLTRWLAAMVARRTSHAAIELSSHSLDQRRNAGTLLDVAIVTNITQDHFDYHQTFAAYRRSKLRIFEQLKPAGVAVVDVDDPGSRSCLERAPRRGVTSGLEQPADCTAHILSTTLYGTTFELSIGAERQLVRTPLIGRHNVSNCLAAAAAAQHFGVALEDIARGIESLACVPGRMEPVGGGQPFPVLVDYAHTDDALRKAIRTLKALTPGRVLCVFGAGGDRDRTKRPRLGQAAAEADLAVVTSDNPRSERPQDIISDILDGMGSQKRRPYVEPDREQAIRWAVQHAGPGDAVLIAGKGHETEQIMEHERRHFDDREVARACLAELYPADVAPRPGLLRKAQPLPT
ncbi:MAG: UDP-N-acetylmuramoyl-L-alanyl-D-glutamate--2,6-diaminopimelate ligase [Planctomycetaceae bacterium]